MRPVRANTVLTAVGAVLAAAAIAAPAAAASPSPAAIGPVAGGAQLSGHGVLVSYPSRAVPRLPKIKASAWVIADAGTGQVLAAKDPHGWFRPASTLKVLTAISLIPALNPNAMVVASKQATTVSPNIVGLLPGHSYKVSDLFTALLTISANDAAMALAQATGSLSHGMAVINAEARHLQADDTVAVTPNVYGERAADLAGLGFVHDEKEARYLAPATPELRELLKKRGIPSEARAVLDPSQADPDKLEQLEAVKRWFNDDWKRIEPKLRTSIVEGVSVFLSLFDDNPKVKRVFCPKKECYDPEKNANYRFGRPLPSFRWLIEHGAVCALNFPIGMNAGLAKALGVMMKLDFQRAVLNRVPEMEAHPERYFRQVLFLCDEYQHFATVGESDPTGDEKFFSLSRQPKCIPIIATQSISSLKSALPGDSWRTLLQTFRTKIFLTLSDDFSARTASELCGREDKLKVNYSLSESGHDTKVSWLTGMALSHKANIVASKSYNTQTDFRFDMKTFTELRNAQSIILAYDGLNPMPPMFCYLKPYYNDPNHSYFKQLAEGVL